MPRFADRLQQPFVHRKAVAEATFLKAWLQYGLEVIKHQQIRPLRQANHIQFDRLQTRASIHARYGQLDVSFRSRQCAGDQHRADAVSWRYSRPLRALLPGPTPWAVPHR
jgi:hypothetical protein